MSDYLNAETLIHSSVIIIVIGPILKHFFYNIFIESQSNQEEKEIIKEPYIPLEDINIEEIAAQRIEQENLSHDFISQSGKFLYDRMLKAGIDDLKIEPNNYLIRITLKRGKQHDYFFININNDLVYAYSSYSKIEEFGNIPKRMIFIDNFPLISEKLSQELDKGRKTVNKSLESISEARQQLAILKSVS